uniref:Uncharacterized protein n=1 Tax=Glossina palpalis gambiensis TaxID=67801 RepID=A0A1B0ASI1_9MUSC
MTTNTTNSSDNCTPIYSCFLCVLLLYNTIVMMVAVPALHSHNHWQETRKQFSFCMCISTKHNVRSAATRNRHCRQLSTYAKYVNPHHHHHHHHRYHQTEKTE